MNQENTLAHDKLYEIAITLVPYIGIKTAKILIAYCGGAKAVFEENKKSLLKIPGIGDRVVRSLLSANVLSKAEENIHYFNTNNINSHYYLNDDSYPQRLKHFDDAPLLLFSKGTSSLNAMRTVAIVGTRQPTQYGRSKTNEIIEGLKAYDVQIISGLAYGIDSATHHYCTAEKIDNIAVMATGLDKIYPSQNTKLSRSIIEKGALLSEFPINTNPERENFPLRNRIIAGMADVIIVIQSAKKGGSLITAEYANAYNKDVFAIPGRTSDEMSIGCNQLIKTNKAHLLESAKDIAYIMRWESSAGKIEKQGELFIDLTEEERILLDKIKSVEEASIDWLHHETQMSLSVLANHLLTLEFKGIVVPLPGKKYGLV